jgi:hypothetical protein
MALLPIKILRDDSDTPERAWCVGVTSDTLTLPQVANNLNYRVGLNFRGLACFQG